MPWQRDMNAEPPRRYKGIQMRSALEVAVAEELDRFGVRWAYEAPAPVSGYLPDFTIIQARPELRLPRWVEVKPADLLWRIRDSFGFPENLHDQRLVQVDITADGLSERMLDEIHKPQYLAATAGEPVLVVSALNRHRLLSVGCFGDCITLSKQHPAVNWKGHIHRLEQERARQRWDAARVAREAEWAAQERARAERNRQLSEELARLVLADDGIPARFPGSCRVRGCGHREADQLRLYRLADEWFAVCLDHVLAVRDR